MLNEREPRDGRCIASGALALLTFNPKGEGVNALASGSQLLVEPLVYLLDADGQVLQSLQLLLAEAGLKAVPGTTAAAFFESFQPHRVGCLVLDLALGDADGLAIQQEICDRGLTLPVVFLSGCASVPASVRAMKAGALDFLTKPVDGHALIIAVRAGIALDLVRRSEATEQRRLWGKFETLTSREKELLPYLVSGLLNKQIGDELCIVEKTVKVHRAHVMTKLGMRSLSDLVRFSERLRVEPIQRYS